MKRAGGFATGLSEEKEAEVDLFWSREEEDRLTSLLFAGGAPLLANLPEESEALGDASKCVLWVSRSAHLPRLGKKRLIPKKIKLESQREEEVYLFSLSRLRKEEKSADLDHNTLERFICYRFRDMVWRRRWANQAPSLHLLLIRGCVLQETGGCIQ